MALLPLAAACWMERPNLQSTGGGYVADGAATRPAVVEDHGAGGTREQPADTLPARLSP